jgi:radical SAM enzyme (TIGR01210 family)
LISSTDISWLRIYQEGSFLNPAEVGAEAREVVLRLASNLRGVERITIESRPEYITVEALDALKKYITPTVQLVIGTGLEAKDDFVRNVCIGKGTSLAAYDRAVEIAHAHGFLALAYVLLKPPFLSEREAIAEATSTVVHAFEAGFDEVYVQAASIHEWSLSDLLATHGLYHTPWLWSVIRVVEKTAPFGVVKVGGLEYFPRPTVTSQNYRGSGPTRTACTCSREVWRLIQEYNANGHADIFGDAECSCRDVWSSEVEMPEDRPLSARVARSLESVSTRDYLHR